MEMSAWHRDSAYSGYASQLDIRGAVILHALLVLQALLAAGADHLHLVAVTLHHVDFGNVILVNTSFLTVVVASTWLLVALRGHPKGLLTAVAIENLAAQVISATLYLVVSDLRQL